MRAVFALLILLPGVVRAQISDVRSINRTDVRGFHYDGVTTSVNLSSNGRYAAMTTYNPTLVPHDEIATLDVIVRDRVAKTFFRVNTQASGEPIALSSAASALIADDGQTAVFEASTATQSGVWRWTASSGEATLLWPDWHLGDMSKTGRFVVLTSGDHARIYDRMTGHTRALEDWMGLTEGSATFGAMSDNGRLIAVKSDRALDPADPRPGWFLLETQKRVPHRVRVDGQVTGISADGQYLCFVTDRSFVPEDQPGPDAYRYDRIARKYELLSTAAVSEYLHSLPIWAVMSESGQLFGYRRGDALEQSGWRCGTVGQPEKYHIGTSGDSFSISDAGDAVAYVAVGENRFPYDRSSVEDALILHMRTGERYGLSLGKEPGWFEPRAVAMSRDGRFTFVVGSDGHSTLHVYDRSTGKTTGVFNYGIFESALSVSSNGRYIAFATDDFRLIEHSRVPQIAVFDREQGTVRVVSKSAKGFLANGPCMYPRISPDGSHVAYDSWANNLVLGLAVKYGQVYHYNRKANMTRALGRYEDGRAAEDSYGASFSADGRSIFFKSSADLRPGGEGYDPGKLYGRLYRFDIAGRQTIGIPVAEYLPLDDSIGNYTGYHTFTDASGNFAFLNNTGSGGDASYIWDISAGKVHQIANSGRQLLGVNGSGSVVALETLPLTTLRQMTTGRELMLEPPVSGFGVPAEDHFAMNDDRVAYIAWREIYGHIFQYAYVADYAFPPVP